MKLNGKTVIVVENEEIIRIKLGRIFQERAIVVVIPKALLQIQYFIEFVLELVPFFFICFEMVTTTKSLSATQMGVRYGITEKTARLFMLKIREAMSSSENHPMEGNVHVDEFVLGGYEQGKVGRSYDAKKKKAVTAIELTDDGKIKRMYAMPIADFSARSLQYIFLRHISKQAKVTTDKWKAYRPISKAYDITQIESNKVLNFKALHIMIHQIKS